MQATKDSFFCALQARLALVNPQRTIVTDGIAKPAVMVVENEPFPPAKLFFNTFYIHWLGAPSVHSFARTRSPRYEHLAQVEYFVRGGPTLERPFADRGRLIGQLDQELIEILYPGFTEKLDYTFTPAKSLSSVLLWRWTPDLRTIADSEGSVLRRIATVSVSSYLEALVN